MSSQPKAEISHLLQNVVDGTLDADQERRLQLLLQQPEARQAYLDQLAINSLLYWSSGRVLQSDPKPTPDEVARIAFGGAALPPQGEEVSPPRMIWNSVTNFFGHATGYSFLTAAAVLIAGLTYLAMFQVSQPAPSMSDALPAASQAIATVVGEHECRWDEASSAIMAGESLRIGSRLSLASGLAAVQFPRGVQLLLQGPARLRVVSERSVELEHGRLTALVSQRGRGFTVETRAASIVDLGTEFGVEVDAKNNLQVAVFAGAVRVDPKHRAAPTHLSAGSSLRFDPVQGWAPVISRLETDRFTRALPKAAPPDRRYRYQFGNGRVMGRPFPGAPLAGQDHWHAVAGMPLARSDSGLMSGTVGASETSRFSAAYRPNNAEFHFDLTGARRFTLSFVGRCGVGPTRATQRTCRFGLGRVNEQGKEFVELLSFGCERTDWVVQLGDQTIARIARQGTELNEDDERWRLALDVVVQPGGGRGWGTFRGEEIGGDHDRRTFASQVELDFSILPASDPTAWNALFFGGYYATMVDDLTVSVFHSDVAAEPAVSNVK